MLRSVLIPPLATEQVVNQAGDLGSLLGRGVGVAFVGHLHDPQASPAQWMLPENPLPIEVLNAVSLPS